MALSDVIGRDLTVAAPDAHPPLGEGGTGFVCKAEDTGLDRVMIHIVQIGTKSSATVNRLWYAPLG